MDKSTISLFFIILAVWLFLRIKVKSKKKKEDEFLTSINYAHRIPEVKTKPKNGKRRSPEEVLADGIAYQNLLGDDFRKKAKADQIKAERVGSKAYKWQGSDCCAECDKQNGRKYH